ncbi:MAG: glutathione S-transferase family protein, partial [Alphaproteobacteria bacterium]
LKMRPIGFLAMKARGLRAVATTEPFHSMIRSSRLAMHEHLDDLDATLAETGGPWVTGEQFTLADVGMMAILDRIREADWESELIVDRRPRVQSYRRALKARPSYAAAVAAHEHPTVVRGTGRIVALKRSEPAFAAALAS